MPSDVSETGLETIVTRYLVDHNGYEEGIISDYNKEYAIDEVRLFRFLDATQKRKMKELRILESDIEKKKFLDRFSRKISDKGVITIIRDGFKYKNQTLDLYMVHPSEGNAEAKEAYDGNIFSVTRQLKYSEDNGKLLDLVFTANYHPENVKV